LRGPQQQRWLISLRAEQNNLRAALQWALDHQEADLAIQLGGSLWRYWWMRGHLREGRDWLEKALTAAGTHQPALRARALLGAGILARTQGDFTGARLFLEECLAIRKDLGDRTGTASALNSLGGVAFYQGEYDLAFEYHQESIQYRREIGDRRNIAVSLANLGMVAQEKGNYTQAEELYRESLALFQEVEDVRNIVAVLANRGSLMNDQGDAGRAEADFRESLSIAKDLGQPDDIIECLEGFAGIAVLRQQSVRGARLFGAVQALRAAIGSPMPPYKQARYRRFLERTAAHMDPKSLESALAGGKQLSLEEAIAYALNE
jgi:tetratricopeptide (TPR) repeat protein